MSRSSLRTIVNIRNAYSTIMTNNLNRVIKLLTALTIILNVPMIISSFYGMNIAMPLGSSSLALVWVIFITLGISSVLYFVFVKNEWF